MKDRYRVGGDRPPVKKAVHLAHDQVAWLEAEALKLRCSEGQVIRQLIDAAMMEEVK